MRSYAKDHTDIVLDGSDKVTEITSSDPDYKKLLIKQVVDELGQPTETVDTSRDIPDTAEANYTINNTSGLSYYLVFSYQTKTQRSIISDYILTLRRHNWMYITESFPSELRKRLCSNSLHF